MTQEEYCTPPSTRVFNQIKKASIAIWNTYDDTYGYASEKINSIKDIKNVSDNWYYMVAMFDVYNQEKLIRSLSGKAKDLVHRATQHERDAVVELAMKGIIL